MSTFGKRNGGGRRGAARQPAPLIAVFTTVSRSNRATVIDVSCTGIRLQTEFPPAVGEEIFVSIEAIRAFGEVVWCNNDEFGVGFDAALCPDDAAALGRLGARCAGLAPEMQLALDVWMGGAPR
jgi:hypothetical protein